jgi:hypothetical protein
MNTGPFVLSTSAFQQVSFCVRVLADVPTGGTSAVLTCYGANYPTSSAMVKSSSACRRTDFTRSSFAVAIRIRRRGAW